MATPFLEAWLSPRADRSCRRHLRRDGKRPRVRLRWAREGFSGIGRPPGEPFHAPSFPTPQLTAAPAAIRRSACPSRRQVCGSGCDAGRGLGASARAPASRRHGPPRFAGPGATGSACPSSRRQLAPSPPQRWHRLSAPPQLPPSPMSSVWLLWSDGPGARIPAWPWGSLAQAAHRHGAPPQAREDAGAPDRMDSHPQVWHELRGWHPAPCPIHRPADPFHRL